MSKEKLPLIQALRVCSLQFRNNEKCEFVISDKNTKTLFAAIVDNRKFLADKLEKYVQLQAENDKLKEERDKAISEIVVWSRKAGYLEAELEAAKKVIEKVHEWSYPGLAIKESTLLNEIYKMTALKEGE